jgi:hypothetical protein
MSIAAHAFYSFNQLNCFSWQAYKCVGHAASFIQPTTLGKHINV